MNNDVKFPVAPSLQIIVNHAEPDENLGAVYNQLSQSVLDMVTDQVLGLRDPGDLVERSASAMVHIRHAIELLQPGFIDELIDARAKEDMDKVLLDRCMHL